ncbi:Maintenance of ploidy protein mob2 [Tritrichomonas musculus]|uniref:Maintenance of ploidy protein mob2 n=1 Tax=Tritrichomonas musculus TaxID=1915356 RepID=A0ABR2KNS2_9EUKA
MIELLKIRLLDPLLNRRPTIVVSNDKKIELSKYRHVQDVSGDHLNININSFLIPPIGMSKNDWIITNLVDFLKRVELLYSSCSLFCTTDTCPLFNAGPKYIYFWLDDNSRNPVQISAPDYFAALKRFIKRNLKNELLFPNNSSENFSTKANYIIQASYRRLFRVLAHLYICHFDDLTKLSKDNLNFFEVMNTILIHYTNITLINNICQPEDFDVFEPIFSKMDNNRNENTNPNFHCPLFSIKSKSESLQK